MGPTAELIWRELFTHSGPSSSIPMLGEDSFRHIGVDSLALEGGIAELMAVGAIIALTGDELTKLSNHKRIAGDLVILRRQSGRLSHFRAIDPNDLRQSIAAQIEAARAELEMLLPQRVALPAPVTAEEINIDKMIGMLEAGTCYYELSNCWILKNAKISGETRLELYGPTFSSNETLAHMGIFFERVQFVGRWFIPKGEMGLAAMRRLIEKWKMEFVIDPHTRDVAVRCDILEAKLDRLGCFALPGWAMSEQPQVSRRERIPKDVQQEVWRRDLGRCVECGSKENLEFDHIIPWGKGGSCTARNIQLLCEACNRKKSDRI